MKKKKHSVYWYEVKNGIEIHLNTDEFIPLCGDEIILTIKSGIQRPQSEGRKNVKRREFFLGESK